MRFRNGAWLNREGVEILSPQFVSEWKKGNGAVYLYGLMDQFNCGMVSVKITAPLPEVFHVHAYHYAGVNKASDVKFELDLPQESLICVEETAENIILTNGSLALTVSKADFAMTYTRDGEVLTESSKNDLGYVKEDWKGYAYSGNDQNAFFRQQLKISVGELFYGLGERFTAFVKNGQTVDIWNEDGGTSSDQSYINVPFYISNKGYGVFVNQTDKVSFEVGSEIVNKVQFSVPGESIDYFVINGPTMKDVIMRYTDITGKPATLPDWSYGLWLSTSFITDYDEKTVLGFIDEMQRREIPLSVFHFDCKWMKYPHWTDLEWDPEVFPDPKGMIKKIHDKGVKVCVWINPYIAQQSRLFAEGAKNGYFLKRTNGAVWQWDMWQPGLAIVDFTNPKACQWYKEKLAEILDMGVDCLKTDFGERIPVDAVYYNGADPVKMHNYYSYLYNRLVFELLEEKKGKNEAVLFARSATAGGQKFPVHWGGDCSANYESMWESLRGGLSLTSSGFGYWSHDIGGFEDTSTPDVYKRWAAFGLLSTHSRLHGSVTYRVPWNYGEEAVDVVRTFTKMKMSLMPYIYSAAAVTAKTGVPMMRSMVMEFTEDENCGYLDRQYMFGERILVAPIFNDKSVGKFYLPQGTWTDYMTGEVTEGGVWVQKEYDYLHIPMMVRENSIIAKGAVDNRPDYDYVENVEFRIYQLKDTAQCLVCNQSGETAKIKASRKGDEIIISLESSRPYTIRLINTAAAADLEGAQVQQDGPDTLIIPKDGSKYSGEVVEYHLMGV